jgi:SAM-dependent methyltransferase
MKKPPEAHAERFDRKAAEYDGDKSEEYRTAVSLVVEHARPAEDDVVLDLGTGTGAIALELGEAAGSVAGRDISEKMLARGRKKAHERGIESVTFETGRFRAPNAPDNVDIVTSNFAMHHLGDAEKREALDEIASLEPRRIVLGDVMLFEGADPEEPFYNPAVDDPATVGVLADAFTDAGFTLTAVERIHGQVGVLVGEHSGERADV